MALLGHKCSGEVLQEVNRQADQKFFDDDYLK